MKRPSDESPENEVLKNLIGLGDSSFQKSYYPQLRKKIQELEEEKQKYQTLFDSISDAICILDIDGNLITMNQEACLRYGLTRDTMTGCHISKINNNCQKNLFERHIDSIKEKGMVSYETSHTNFNNSTMYCEVSARLITFNGKPAIMSVCRDITDKKHAEQEKDKLKEQLQQSQKLEAIGQLAGGVAHDFNNILTAILGYAEMSLDEMQDQLDPDHNLVEAMEQIEQSAQRASSLTRQLLAFSRRQIFKPERINLNKTLTDLDKMLRRLITENVMLKTVTAPDLKEVLADAGQLEQVVVNLIVNASDAMPDGGTLTLETKNITLDEGYVSTHTDARPGDYVLLSVSDTGRGMTGDIRQRIFEPFFTTKPKGRGTGLGLSMVHGIIKQTGGEIMVYSEPGHGTIFKIFLPVASESDPVHFSTPTPQNLKLTGTETILLCEDDDPVRDLIRNALFSAGYTVLDAENGKQASMLASSHEGDIHMLITDVIMPDMNGKIVAQNLMNTIGKEIPTLYISGYTSNVIAHHGVLDRGVEFLEKPFSRIQLLHSIREVLEKDKEPLQ